MGGGDALEKEIAAVQAKLSQAFVSGPYGSLEATAQKRRIRSQQAIHEKAERKQAARRPRRSPRSNSPTGDARAN